MRVLVLADVSNLFYTVKKNLSARLDYEKLLSVALNGRELYRAIAYGIQIDGSEAFINVLKNIGFETKFKPPKIWFGTDSKPATKADWDVQMAVDAIKFTDRIDAVILLSADGDLAPCLEYIKFKGVRTEVIACGISRDLKDIADYWQEIGPDLFIRMEPVNEIAAV